MLQEEQETQNGINLVVPINTNEHIITAIDSSKLSESV